MEEEWTYGEPIPDDMPPLARKPAELIEVVMEADHEQAIALKALLLRPSHQPAKRCLWPWVSYAASSCKSNEE